MKRWIAAFGAVIGLGAPATLAVAREVTPDQAPAAWVDYARASMLTITDWLNADQAPATGVRAAIDATRSAPDQPAPPVVVKIWLDSQGVVTRADFPSLGATEADAGLRVLLVGRQLKPPPSDMRQPMRIALQLPDESKPPSQ